jgi:hypothetical protein
MMEFCRHSLAAPPGALGSWIAADVQAVLNERMK